MKSRTDELFRLSRQVAESHGLDVLGTSVEASLDRLAVKIDIAPWTPISGASDYLAQKMYDELPLCGEKGDTLSLCQLTDFNGSTYEAEVAISWLHTREKELEGPKVRSLAKAREMSRATNTTNVSRQMALALWHECKGELEAAISEYRRLHQMYLSRNNIGRAHQVARQLADCLFQIGPTQAHELVERSLLELDTQWWGDWFNWATWLLTRLPEKAVPLFQRVLAQQAHLDFHTVACLELGHRCAKGSEQARFFLDELRRRLEEATGQPADFIEASARKRGRQLLWTWTHADCSQGPHT